MAAKANIWYRLGYAWENARLGPAARSDRQTGEQRSPLRSGNGSDPTAARNLADALPWQNLLGEAGGLARRAVAKRAHRAPSSEDYLRATVAGAGAALATRSVRALFPEDVPVGDDPGLRSELLQGVGHGLALAVLARYLPAGRLLRVALFTTARYGASSRGGLLRVIRPIAPTGVKALTAVTPETGHDRGLLEHVAFAAAFVLLYRPGAAATG